MMKKVDVFVVGGAKCGTTWLHNMLCQRSDISMPEQKETNFFSYIGKDVNFSGPLDDKTINNFTIKDLDAYHALFSHADNLWLEVCPSYLCVKEAAKNIYDYNKDAKIIIILRNPVERAWSNHQFLVSVGAEDRSFEDALMLEEERESAGWSWIWNLYRQGLYAQQVERYLSFFPRKMVYIAKFEDIHKNQELFIRSLEDFIGLKHYSYRSSVEKNVSGNPPRGMIGFHRLIFAPGTVNNFLRLIFPIKIRKILSSLFKRIVMKKSFMKKETKELLENKYADEIVALEKVTGEVFPEWRKDENR